MSFQNNLSKMKYKPVYLKEGYRNFLTIPVEMNTWLFLESTMLYQFCKMTVLATLISAWCL